MMKTNFWLAIILAFGFVLRLVTSTIGYHGDLNNNISWGKVAYEQGLSGFYGSANSDDWEFSAPNQPPLTIITLAGAMFINQKITELIWNLNDNLQIFPSGLVWFWESWGTIILIKLPSIIADCLIAYILYLYFKNQKKDLLGLKIAALWMFNPVTWYNSGVWGQTDAIVNLLGLSAVFYLVKRDLSKFAVLFTLSILFKGSLAIFIPVLLFYILVQKYSLKAWAHSAAYSVLTVVLISIWFYPQIGLFKSLLDLYTQRFIPGEIGFLTANAFNFWWLVDSGAVYDSIVYFGLPARTLGILATLLSNLGVMYWLYKKPDEKRLIASLILVSLISFLFMTRIHERYLFPFFPVSTLLLGILPNLWLIYTLFSITHLLNLYNLFWVPSFPLLENILTFSWFTNLLALINILLFAATLRQIHRSNI